jgi:hypothetical protein
MDELVDRPREMVIEAMSSGIALGDVPFACLMQYLQKIPIHSSNFSFCIQRYLSVKFRHCDLGTSHSAKRVRKIYFCVNTEYNPLGRMRRLGVYQQVLV